MTGDATLGRRSEEGKTYAKLRQLGVVKQNKKDKRMFE